jgi:P4 family phage/plasmid primase-like protien
MMIRKNVVAKIAEIWSDIPITNTWEEVFDEGISRGHTNLQLYGSMKPHNQAYRLTRIHMGGYDENGGVEFHEPSPSPAAYENEANIFKLSVRYPNHAMVMLKSDTVDKLTQLNKEKHIGHNRGGVGEAGGGEGGAVVKRHMDDDDEDNHAVHIDEILAIRSKAELDQCVARFLDSLELKEYDIRDAYEYVMILPKSYYGEGSFSKWIRVGWALRNMHNKLFIVWLAFSAKSPTFCWATDIDMLYEKWAGFVKETRQGYTIRSIMYWAKTDNFIEYKNVATNSIDAYINKTLDISVSLSNDDDNKIHGFTDFDIACVLYHLSKENYVCVSVKHNIWYRFNNHYWVETDSGTGLRMSISKELRELYYRKRIQLMKIFVTVEKESIQGKGLTRKINILGSIVEKLGKTNDKKNIMTECKELFYDEDFMRKVDGNPYIICFSNGVVDFKEKRMRIGTPQDYLTKCTGINYRPLNREKDKRIIGEIEDFMHKLFPDNDLYKYMWEHLASTLIGTTTNQTFNMYIGVGQNGKSVLVNLMELVLGQYKGDVPLTLITQQRTKIGGVSPEIIQLKGTRYAVMQEPSKGDKINEGIMKQLSAGDALTGRAPYMIEAQTFTPQFKLVVCSNEFMEIKSQDHGTWRRIRVVPFESLFTENPQDGDLEKPYQYKLDKNIKEKFESWKEVFAAMLVEKAYETEGNVQDCNKVNVASNAYRKGQDTLSEYLIDRVETHPVGCITKGQLATDFKEWVSLNIGASRTLTVKDLVISMDKRFHKNVGGIWKGVRFIPPVKNINMYDDDEDDGISEKGEGGCDFNLQEL